MSMEMIMIDLVINEHGIHNPCLIAEKIEELFDHEVNILFIDNYISETLEIPQCDYYNQHY